MAFHFVLLFFLSRIITNSDQQQQQQEVIPEYLNSMCNQTNSSSCSLIPNSNCVNAGDNSGEFRCRCQYLYYPYSYTPTVQQSYRCGLELSTAVNSACAQCEQNGGKCVANTTTSPTIFCQCPVSFSGTNCQIIHVNVTCTGYDMRVCYFPHSNVNFSDGWTMFASGQMSLEACVGSPGNTTWCPAGFEELELSLNKTDYKTCGTQLTYGSQNMEFSNQMIVAQFNNAGNQLMNVTPYVFNVFCSFINYEDQNFNGVGVGSANGNDDGLQVNPTVMIQVDDEFGPIPQGSNLDVGDDIKLLLYLTLDGVYGNMQVLDVTASTSPIMPDSEAQTRVLMTKGCPLPGDSTASSFYWTPTQISNSSLLLESLFFNVFELSSSNQVFFHGIIKVCLLGDNSCVIYNQTYCDSIANSLLTKRDLSNQFNRLIRRTKRATTTQVNVQTGIQIGGSPNSSPSPNGSVALGLSSPGVIFLIVFLAIISIILIASVVFAIIMTIGRQSKNPVNRYDSRPQLFAIPKISRTHERF